MFVLTMTGDLKTETFLSVQGTSTSATITYAAITSDGKVRAPATADIAGGTTSSIAVPEKEGDADVVGYVVSASGDAAYGAVLIQQDGRSDVSTLAFLAAAAGQETVPVTLSH